MWRTQQHRNAALPIIICSCVSWWWHYYIARAYLTIIQNRHKNCFWFIMLLYCGVKIRVLEKFCGRITHDTARKHHAPDTTADIIHVTIQYRSWINILLVLYFSYISWTHLYFIYYLFTFIIFLSNIFIVIVNISSTLIYTSFWHMKDDILKINNWCNWYN